jgi:formate hydrogenlyase transcriptional activator
MVGMQFFFLTTALITAGISLAMGSVSLISGLSRDGEKVDLIFGVMCLSLFLFFIIPPVGFVWEDRAPYSNAILFKRVFNFLYGAMLPWFILLYSGYKKRLIPIGVSIGFFVSFLVMFFTVKESVSPAWMTIALISLGLASYQGFAAFRFQWKNGEKKKARWLLIAMMIFMALYLPTAFNQLSNNYLGRLIHAKIFYPINFFSLAFCLIMGTRLRANSNERFRLERILRLREIHWSALLGNMQILVIRLNREGFVKYVNPYTVALLGYEKESEILNRNWFDEFLPAGEISFRKTHFLQVMLMEEKSPHHKGEVLCKNDEKKIITWSNQIIYDDDGRVDGHISIGRDVTDQEKYFLQVNELKAALEKENLQLKGETLPEWTNVEIIGKSQATAYAIQKARQVAQTNATVLLEGETGVGKELFADLIQRTSMRNMLPYVKVNCGALPAELIEDELFGHEKGAFTGAIQSRKGRFEMAQGGTIFLDELGELPLVLQPKLLRVLQNGEFERVGGHQTLKVDVRVIAATNRDLGKEVRDGRFRDDLYYRLNVFPITIPALRNRPEDIPELTHYFIDIKAREHGRYFQNISKADITRLQEYAWPGNIRELKNVIERAVISSPGDTLRIDNLSRSSSESGSYYLSNSSMEGIEKEHILKILNECGWKINGEHGAADLLAMHPSTLRSRMKKLNINRRLNEPS